MILDRLASRLGSSCDVPNRELAMELSAAGDEAAINELFAGLQHRDKALQSDCIKTLYEIGYIRPELLSDHAGALLPLLKSQNNRLVWGAMIALSTVAKLNSDVILSHIDLVYEAMKQGSVITVDNGVRVLAGVASAQPERSKEICGYLFEHLKTCRPQEVPQHAESTLPAVNAGNKQEFLSVLKSREPDMKLSQSARICKLYKALSKINY